MDHWALWRPFRVSRAFAALWAGQVLSGLGNSAFEVILPLVVYSLTGSVGALSVMMTLRVLPQVVLQPVMGVWVDRWPRVSLMLQSDVLRFVVLLALGMLDLRHALTMRRLDAAVLVFGTVSVVFRPAYMSLRRQIFTSEIRTAAIAATQMGTQVTSLVGPSLGGVLMTLGSAVAGFWFDAATFLGSIGSLLFIRATEVQLQQPPPRSATPTLFRDLGDGWRETARHPWIWVGNVVWIFIIIAYAGYIPILLPWLLTIHNHYPAYTYGLAMAMAGVGSLVMGAVVGSVRTWRRRGVLAYGAIALQAVALGVIPIIPGLPGVMVAMAVSAAGSTLFGIVHEGILQELVPDDVFGRVMSVEVFSAAIALPIGYLFTGFLFRHLGGVHAMLLEAGSMFAAVIGTLALPSIRRFD